MIFYDCSTAPSPRRARMFIAEKGLNIETRDISIAKGEQLSNAFRAINPRATLPTLVTNTGQTLTENIAIATYLEALHPEPPLMGTTPEEKAEIAMWNAIAEQQGGMPVAEVLRNTNPHLKGRALPGPLDLAQIPELAERGKLRLTAFFDMLENHLQRRPFVAGDRFTLADITTFVFIDFARVIKTRIPEGNDATRTWFENVGARPSAAL
ncbi:MAG: glutathione S-transferase [Rhodobacterales bacterium]|nr:MAG: glutathione S-transferase [Rhodobacterales bacterium]